MNNDMQSNVIQMSGKLVEASRKAIMTSSHANNKSKLCLDSSNDQLMQNGFVEGLTKMQDKLDLLWGIVEALVVERSQNQTAMGIDTLVFEAGENDTPSKRKLRTDMCIDAAIKREKKEFESDRTTRIIGDWISEPKLSQTNLG